MMANAVSRTRRLKIPRFSNWSARTSQKIVWSSSAGFVASDGSASQIASTSLSSSNGSRETAEIAARRSAAKSPE
jgi:hypothetical protein